MILNINNLSYIRAIAKDYKRLHFRIKVILKEKNKFTEKMVTTLISSNHILLLIVSSENKDMLVHSVP